MRDTHHIGTGLSTCIHVYMIQLHVWSATCVVGLNVWSATCVVGYMCGQLHERSATCGRLHEWLWSPPHLACMDGQQQVNASVT